MAKEVKCRSCGTWNKGGIYNCTNCNELIDAGQIEKKERETQELDWKQRLEERKGKFEKFIERLEKSKKSLVKYSVLLIRTVWLIYFSILSAIMWILFWLPG